MAGHALTGELSRPLRIRRKQGNPPAKKHVGRAFQRRDSYGTSLDQLFIP
jgi:hypothetical protein